MVIRGAIRRSRSIRCDDRPTDAGTTLLELLVGMTIMGIFMTMFTVAISSMFDSTNRAESLTSTSAQLNAAFNRMDNVVRYATAISQPGQLTTGVWYVELQANNRQTGAGECTQFRITTPTDPRPSQLQQRTWTVLSGGSATVPSGFATVASNITVGASQPFARVLGTEAVPYEQLQFQLQSSSANGQAGAVSQSNITFTALNTTPSTSDTGICTEVPRP